MKNEEKIIALKDDYGVVYVSTNAPKREIEEAIKFKNSIREKEDSPISDFEIIQEFLFNKGYFFDEQIVEEYYW